MIKNTWKESWSRNYKSERGSRLGSEAFSAFVFRVAVSTIAVSLTCIKKKSPSHPGELSHAHDHTSVKNNGNPRALWRYDRCVTPRSITGKCGGSCRIFVFLFFSTMAECSACCRAPLSKILVEDRNVRARKTSSAEVLWPILPNIHPILIRTTQLKKQVIAKYEWHTSVWLI